jgi:hypothetical protein
MARIAGKLWREAGGNGDPPAMVVATVGAHLSARFTAAVLQDAGESWSTAADLSYAAIADALERERGGQSARSPLT